MSSRTRRAASTPASNPVTAGYAEDAPQTNYVVGIDLGTTNSALSYVDLRQAGDVDARSARSFISDLLIPQATAPNVVESRDLLPSFFARVPDAPACPWEEAGARRGDFSTKAKAGGKAGGARKNDDGKFGVVGTYARDAGELYPESFVSSAKSWLCCSNVDRTAKFLPLFSAEGEKTPKWSPVEITSYYLAHLRAAWNHQFPSDPLESQAVVVAIPASFDETARELTLLAAKQAGLPRVSLVEEPQAAFYAWLSRNERDWSREVQPGDKILVCDVGGGTSDFALIHALEREPGEAGEKTVKFYRVAVGDHVLLGGDNFDLALLRYVESRLPQGEALSQRERATALKECRALKERVLSGKELPPSFRIRFGGGGSKLVGGGRQVEVNGEEIARVLVDGFFPTVPLATPPARRRAGLRELALPYSEDPAITRVLARFLTSSRGAAESLARAGIIPSRLRSESEADASHPDAILFNGGVFESPILRERVVEALAGWFATSAEPAWRPKILHSGELRLAVARGAAYYGLALRGLGARVGASLARSYYVEVAGSAGSGKRQGVCLLSAQAEPGDESRLPQTFELEVDRPVAFPIFVSSVRATDAPGDLIALDSLETRELPPIRTALKTRSQTKRASGRIQAKLVARPTEIGTIELFLEEVLPTSPSGVKRGRASRWKLLFDARGATQSDWEASDASGEAEGVVDESIVENGLRVVEATFGACAGEERIKPKDFYRRLTEAIGTSRNDAPITALRRLADRTLELSEARKGDATLESRWLNWLGFALRPGFGTSTDDWRVEQAWKTIAGGLAHGTPECRAQYWILWRRIGAGLSAGRQLSLAEPLLNNLRNFRRQLAEGKGKGSDLDLTSQEGAEIWRLLGSLELLPPELKEEIGDAALDVIFKRRAQPVRDAIAWALGRLGARKPFHATADKTLSGEVARRWLGRYLDGLQRSGATPSGSDFFALAQTARSVGDARIDVDAATRDKVAAFIARYDAEESTLAALERNGRLIDEETTKIFGESLPLGLKWS